MSQPIKKVIIVDDELAARKSLKNVLDAFPGIEVIAEISDGKTAIEKITVLKPDIVFLDIEMPGDNGFDVAKATKHIGFQLVFLTACQGYALKAFDTQAIDYLVKPVRPELIRKSIAKMLHQESIILPTPKDEGRLILTEGGHQKVIEYDHINYIEAIGRYRCIHLNQEGENVHSQNSIVSSLSFEEFLDNLSDKYFFRLHRSYIVNLKKVTEIKIKSRRHFATLSHSNTEIPISRKLVKETKDKIHAMMTKTSSNYHNN